MYLRKKSNIGSDSSSSGIWNGSFDGALRAWVVLILTTALPCCSTSSVKSGSVTVAACTADASKSARGAKCTTVYLNDRGLRIVAAMEQVASKIGAVNAVVATDVTYSGNTSAASIPLALSKLLEENPLPSGAPVLLFAFGGGLAYAGQVVKLP